MSHIQVQSGSDRLALQAELAGAALGCRYSSSDEYEAALIAERRQAGAYGSRVSIRAVVGIALAAALLFIIS